MAAVKHARGVKLLLKVGDGNSPEVFTGLCTINTDRELAFDAATNDFAIPDCSDVDLVAWLAREKVSLSSSFTGGGTVNTPDLTRIDAFLRDPDSRNCQIVMDVPAADGGVIWEGPYHLTNWKLSGTIGAKAQGSITLASDGEVTMTVNT